MIPVTVYLSPDMLKQLDDKRDMVDRSTYIRFIIGKFLEHQRSEDH
jgi:metal-responsive CopG/Arc/MetJ family transcriptional regulator